MTVVTATVGEGTELHRVALESAAGARLLRPASRLHMTRMAVFRAMSADNDL